MLARFSALGLITTAFCLFVTSETWANTAESLLSEAQKHYIVGIEDNSVEELERAKVLLDQIVTEFPSSDISVQILLQETLGNLDVGLLDSMLEEELLRESQTLAAPVEENNESALAVPPEENTLQYTPESSDTGSEFATEPVVTENEVEEPIAAEQVGTIENFAIPEFSDQEGNSTDNVSIKHNGALTYAQEVESVIGRCFTGGDLISAPKSIGVRFELDKQGELKGIPEPIENGELDSEVRRVFFDAIVAIEDCAPFPEPNNEVVMIAMFSGDGQVAVSLQPDRQKETSTPTVSNVTNKEWSFTRASKADQNKLKLKRDEKKELQRRLELLGFDPKGVDGSLGKNTRDAISAWQRKNGAPVSGYVNSTQLEAIRYYSAQLYEDYITENPPRKATRKLVKVCKRSAFGILVCRREYRWY